MLGKAKDGSLDPLSLLDGLLPVYEELLAEFKAAGADWVQLDEPVLALDLSESWSRLSEQFFRVDKWSLCRG